MNAKSSDALRDMGINPNADESRAPIDLRIIPRDRWVDYIGHPVAFPPDVEAYLAGTERNRLSLSEIDNIEIAMDRHYGTAPEFSISLWPNGTAYLDLTKTDA